MNKMKGWKSAMEVANHKGLILRCIFAALSSTFLMLPTTHAETSSWQGSYMGAYLGGGYGNMDATTDAGSVTDTSYFTNAADVNSVNNAGTWNKNPSTMIIGLQAGHDWAWKQIILGVVLDYGALPLNSTNTVTNTYSSGSNQYSVYTSMTTNWLLTLRGRLGYPVTLHWPSLLYLTGGMAITQLSVKNDFSDNAALAGAGSSNISENQLGWTAGAGIEILSYGHASADFEYLYVYVPSVKTNASITNTQGGFGIPPQSLTNTFATTGKFHANVFKIAVNYRFDE